MCNMDVRDAIKRAGLRHWMIADRMGISESTFCKIMRKELPEERKNEILRAIENQT